MPWRQRFLVVSAGFPVALIPEPTPSSLDSRTDALAHNDDEERRHISSCPVARSTRQSCGCLTRSTSLTNRPGHQPTNAGNGSWGWPGDG